RTPTTESHTLYLHDALPILEYVKVKTFNPYTGLPISVILASSLVGKFFKKEAENAPLENYKPGDKLLPWQIADTFSGKELVDLRYEQLMPYVTSPELLEKAFRVIPGDFVTTEDGTGVVHASPTYGADDFRVAQQHGIPAILVEGEDGKMGPTVDRNGRFVDAITDFAGRYVKEEYYSQKERDDKDFKPTDVLIAIKLKEDNKA